MLRTALLFVLCSFTVVLPAQEICTNGIDDDADGLVDLNDTTDCACLPAGADQWLGNGSFEDMDCCPYTYSYLNCASPWVQPSAATPDFFHTCGYFPDWIPTPLPDGEGCAGGYETGNYQEYLGTRLNQPLLAGHVYTIRMHVAAVLADNQQLVIVQPIDFGATEITVFGYADTTFYLPNYSCPAQMGSLPIGSGAYQPLDAWQTLQFTLQPTFDVNTIQIGGPCVLPTSYGMDWDGDIFYPYFLYDGITVSEGEITVAAAGSWCNDDLVLHATAPEGAALQWFVEGIALPGSTDSTLALSALGLSSGTYEVTATTDTSCSVMSYVVEPAVQPTPVITGYGDWVQYTGSGILQWYLNGEPITMPGGPDYFYPTESGNYTVEVTNEQGCTGLSEPFLFIHTALPEAGADVVRVVYATGGTLLQVLGARGPFHCQVFDAAGHLLLDRTGAPCGWELNVGDLPRGVYVVRIDERTFRIMR
jgi:hypothetical protein